VKKPSLPRNEGFWLTVARNEGEADKFRERGNARQVRALYQAEKYIKWSRIQGKVL